MTVTALVAAATETLEDSGYAIVESPSVGNWRATVARVYEDPYSIVCVAVYETWGELRSSWANDQAILVGLISTHFSRTDAKAWDGYLVLLTPSIIPTTDRQVAIDIQKETVHLRKLFAAAGEFPSVDAVRQVLLPLLPLEQHDALKPRDALDSLPSLLARRGIEENATRAALQAFLDNSQIIEQIHEYLTNEREVLE